MSEIATVGVSAVITELRESAQHLGIPDGPVTGYTVSLDGVDVAAPVYSYEVASTEYGPHLTITVGVSSVQVGETAPGQPQTAAAKPAGRGKVRVWEPSVKDPREGIPGWQPEGEPEVDIREPRGRVDAAGQRLDDAQRGAVEATSALHGARRHGAAVLGRLEAEVDSRG